MLHHRLEKRAVIYTHFLKFPIKSIISHKSFTKCLSHSGFFSFAFPDPFGGSMGTHVLCVRGHTRVPKHSPCGDFFSLCPSTANSQNLFSRWVTESHELSYR